MKQARNDWHELEVVPDLSDLRFILATHKPTPSLERGGEVSRHCGSGSEFIQSRPYLPGDALKSVDWRAYARTGRVLVKEFESPRRSAVYLVVDRSASMTISSRPLSKYRMAVELAGGLAFAALQQMLPLSLAVSDGSRVVHPSDNTRKVRNCLYDLRRFPMGSATRLEHILRCLQKQLVQRATVIILSDFCDPDDLEEVARLASRHDLIALECVDPYQVPPIKSGWVRTREAEHDTLGFQGARADLTRAGDVAEFCRKHHVAHLTLRTDQQPIPILREYLRRRSRRHHALRA